MTTPDPLATYLITGGLPRVCEELARLMRSCHDSIGHHLPSLEPFAPPLVICGDECTNIADGPIVCTLTPGHIMWHQNGVYTWPLIEPAHPAPQAFDDKRALRAGYGISSDRAAANNLQELYDRAVASCRELRSERNDAWEELERVRAKNARLENERAEILEQLRVADTSVGGIVRAKDEFEKLAMELQTENVRLVAEVEKSNGDHEHTSLMLGSKLNALTESERIVSELRAELAKREEERVKLLKYYFPEPESANPEAVALGAELRRREAAVEAARLELEKLVTRAEPMISIPLFNDFEAVISALEQPQAERGREIVVGSTWKGRDDFTRIVTGVENGVSYDRDDGGGLFTCHFSDEASFRADNAHISDPPVSEVEQRCRHPTVRLQKGFVVCLACGQVPKKSDFDPPVSEGEG